MNNFIQINPHLKKNINLLLKCENEIHNQHYAQIFSIVFAIILTIHSNLMILTNLNNLQVSEKKITFQFLFIKSHTS